MPGFQVFEEHGQVSALWIQAPYAGGTVVCFDRHLDLKPLAPGGEQALLETVRTGADPAGVLRQLPLRGVPGAFGLDDFWAAAALTGQIHELVWVPSWGEHPGWISTALGAVSLVATGGSPTDAVSSPCCLTVTLCGARVSVVPWERLAEHVRVHVSGEVVVDVDLDWLVDEHGRVDHPPARLAELIAGAEITAMTWSTRSGFLPAEYRTLSADVARKLGRWQTLSAFLPAVPWPERLLLDVHRGADPQTWLDQEHRLRQDAPGVAEAMLGLLVVDRDLPAAVAWFEAGALAGYTSSWLAYGIGVRLYAGGSPTEAVGWLERSVAADPRDTLALHALLLLARARLRTHGEAAALAGFTDLAAELPLRASVWQTVELLAARPGTDPDGTAGEAARRARAHLAALVATPPVATAEPGQSR